VVRHSFGQSCLLPQFLRRTDGSAGEDAGHIRSFKKAQITLARDLGINDYPALPEDAFSPIPMRWQDQNLIDHGELDMQNINLLNRGDISGFQKMQADCRQK